MIEGSNPLILVLTGSCVVQTPVKEVRYYDTDHSMWCRHSIVASWPTYLEDITRLREDVVFMFEWRYCSCHENIESISLSYRVMFYLLYEQFECS